MPTYPAHDGLQLAYQVSGEGAPVVCLPGGPMQDTAYLGDLGGLSGHRKLILADPRGTGQSATPEDTSSYRCDRQVDDVEALRKHLGLSQMDLLGHSAGTNLAVLYTARYPDNVSKLALITPSPMAVGIAISGQTRLDCAQLRRNEPWFPAAFAALQAITAGEGTNDDWEAITPFLFGRWDAAARSHHEAGNRRKNQEAARIFASDGAFDPASTRASLAACASPVLALAGEFDLNSPPQSVAELAGLFPDATFVVQPGAGHSPWRDDADRFAATTAAFLG